MKNSTKWLVYAAIPLALSATLQGMYFSGNLVLQRLACPKLPPLNPNSYREFGLIENAQNLMLLAMVVILLVGVRRATYPRLKLLYALLALFSVFVFLEEIDYGTHFYRFATVEALPGWFEPATSPEFQALMAQTDFTSEPFNIHNKGDLTDMMKLAVNLLIIGLFVVAPFLHRRIQNPWIRHFLPERFVVVTVVVMVLMRLLTGYLEGMEAERIAADKALEGPARYEVSAMNSNLSEFRELLTYYLFLVYLAVLVFLRREPETSAASSVDRRADHLLHSRLIAIRISYVLQTAGGPSRP